MFSSIFQEVRMN